MEELANGGVWINGERFSSSVSDADIAEWIDGIEIGIQ